MAVAIAEAQTLRSPKDMGAGGSVNSFAVSALRSSDAAMMVILWF
jgi:hypothetical protein